MEDIKEQVDYFAIILLGITPIYPKCGRGYFGFYTDKTNKRKQMFISHQHVLELYSNANRMLRGLPYDTHLVVKDVQGNYSIRLVKKELNHTFMRSVALSTGMEMLFDIPLTGGMW